MGCGNSAVALDTASGRSQLEFGHNPLSAFMIDSQMNSDATMTIGRMLSMHRFDLLFEGEISGWLFELPIDVLAVDAQCVGTD